MADTRKNILHLIADDLGKCLGCYGAKGVKTPNIDALARGSVVFDNAFTSTASCSPSRTVMYTGLHPHETGQYGLLGGNTHFQCFDHIQSGVRLFNFLGYRTGIIGKVHVGPPDVFPWQTREESETRNVAWTAERAEAFFQGANESTQPFYLTVGYVDPHRDIWTRGEFGNKENCDGNFIASDFQPSNVEIPSWLTDLEETRTEYVEYYKAIERFDYGIGLVLDALNRQGLVESTLVVLCSDNGPPFINSKTTLYDAGVRLPFLVRKPGSSKPGIHNPNMISYIDILPTFLDWAGAPLDCAAPAKTEGDQVYTRETRPPAHPRRVGRSFLSIIDRADILPDTQWEQRVHGSHTVHEIANYWPTRFVRDRRFKYHRNIAWRLDFPFASDLYASRVLEGIRRNPERTTDGDVKVGQRSLKNYIKRPAEELFDLEKDPDELVNLAGEAEYKDKLLSMRKDMELWQDETKDPWLLRDGQSVHALSRYRNDGLEVPQSWDFVADAFEMDRITKLKIDAVKPLEKDDKTN
ncbi:N-sulfoglucosamine sulfohydrolase [Geosmithia morbida]|uniref:N-sulfoglucosamine sulfohydrolase n=1 Tax=Geosmithia morbida TaxID=1094350 RepID=A0A9P4YZW8_9HYPO|nr:N-sulfoglucosamine sulfohydrolase [Geosmithia morbida]KAF4124854.1 N-sulfoglucosamine sulfohydrolase [Geosmithia morbida]